MSSSQDIVAVRCGAVCRTDVHLQLVLCTRSHCHRHWHLQIHRIQRVSFTVRHNSVEHCAQVFAHADCATKLTTQKKSEDLRQLNSYVDVCVTSALRRSGETAFVVWPCRLQDTRCTDLKKALLMSKTGGTKCDWFSANIPYCLVFQTHFSARNLNFKRRGASKNMTMNEFTIFSMNLGTRKYDPFLGCILYMRASYTRDGTVFVSSSLNPDSPDVLYSQSRFAVFVMSQGPAWVSFLCNDVRSAKHARNFPTCTVGRPSTSALFCRPQILILLKLNDQLEPKYRKMLTFSSQLKAGRRQPCVTFGAPTWNTKKRIASGKATDVINLGKKFWGTQQMWCTLQISLIAFKLRVGSVQCFEIYLVFLLQGRDWRWWRLSSRATSRTSSRTHKLLVKWASLSCRVPHFANSWNNCEVNTIFVNSSKLYLFQAVSAAMKKEKSKGFSEILAAENVAEGLNHL